MNKLLIATNNPGKVKELQELLKGLNIELITPSQINLDLDVIEDGVTYAENATKKALAFAQASNLISLADDSGLEVDALNGEPGLYSARYGSTNGKKLSDAERRTYLLSNLQDKPRPWTARFRAVIAITIPSDHVTLSEAKSLLLGDEQVYLTEGICPGEIIPAERGANGFGYDPIFLLPELGKTMAELSMDEKNRLSHRARAVMKAKEILKKLY
jgi:XTP/dITP diphosphohydrolase